MIILLSMFLAGLLLFSFIPLGVAAPKTDDWFEITDGVLYFQEERYSGGSVLTVPEAIDGQTVTALSVGCFENLTGVTTIVLPKTLTEIRERAFQGCTDLRGLKVPESVTTIGAGALRGCTALEAVFLSTGVGSIGPDAFSGCSSLLYVFYNGLYQYLQGLYPDTINPYTYAVCLDGIYQFGLN